MGRRSFTREFKVEAVRLVRERGVAINQAAQDLDIHPNVLRNWLKDSTLHGEAAFPGRGRTRPEDGEVARLRREFAKTQAELDILKKNYRLLRQGTQMRFSFIAQHRGVWQTRQMCRVLGVSRAGFYEWMGRPQSNRARENQALLVSIRTSFEQSDRTYGGSVRLRGALLQSTASTLYARISEPCGL